MNYCHICNKYVGALAKHISKEHTDYTLQRIL